MILLDGRNVTLATRYVFLKIGRTELWLELTGYRGMGVDETTAGGCYNMELHLGWLYLIVSRTPRVSPGERNHGNEKHEAVGPEEGFGDC